MALTHFFFFFNAVFKDKNTPSPFIEAFPEDDEAAKASKPDHIYMDAMGFGMGNCCLQVLAPRQRRMPSPTPLYNFCPLQVCVSTLKSIFNQVEMVASMLI